MRSPGVERGRCDASGWTAMFAIVPMIAALPKKKLL